MAGSPPAPWSTQLREGGHDGSITVFTEEPRAPYERPPLSKDLLLGKGTEDKALVQEEGWYAEHDVDLRIGTAVTSLDLAAREVVAGADRTAYDHLVLATGSRPRTCGWPTRAARRSSTCAPWRTRAASRRR